MARPLAPRCRSPPDSCSGWGASRCSIWRIPAAIGYRNGVQVSYSLNTFMPVEGHHLAFNGTKGRIEIRQYERQSWETPDYDEILLLRNFGAAERIRVPHEPGGHFGGDPKLHRMLFGPSSGDPLRQRAGAEAGAWSALSGVAALESAKSGKPVRVPELFEADARMPA